MIEVAFIRLAILKTHKIHPPMISLMLQLAIAKKG
jgi:hypothetical protein